MNWAKTKTILPLFSLLTLFACSHGPQGKVVRLDPLSQNTSEAEHPSAMERGEIPMHTQAGLENAAVPSAKDDAAVYYFSLGQAYSLDNETGRAIEAYRAALVYDPKSSLIRARLAAELIKGENFAEARTFCEAAIASDPKYLDSYLLLAGIQVSAKEYNAALATYRKALEQSPHSHDALLYYGVTLAENGKTDEAVAQLEKLVKLKDTDESGIDQSVGYFYLAKVQQQANRLDAAIQALDMSLKKRPGFAKAAILESEIYTAKHKPQKAREVLETAFQENHQAELAERLAEIYLEAGDFRASVVYLETLVEVDTANENVRLRLALVYWQLGWLDKARMVFVDLHDRYPTSSEISFYLGEVEMERKSVASARAYYEQVAVDYAKYDQAVARIVGIYRAEKKYDEAEHFVRQAIKKRSDIVAFYPLLGSLYEDENKLTDARDTLEVGQKLFPAEESILYYLGFLYDRLGSREKSFALMEQILQLNPNNANALNFVGYSLLEKGKELAKAEQYLRRAYELKPQDAYILDSYGWLLCKEGKQKLGMIYLEKAFQLHPEEAVIAEHLADAYVDLHLPAKALLVYQKALGVESSEEGLKSRVALKIQNVRNTMARGPSERTPASMPDSDTP